MNKNIVEQKIKELGGIESALGGPTVPMLESQLLEIEKTIEATLPVEYREFIKEYGANKFATLVIFRPQVNLPDEISSSGCGCFDYFFGADNEEGAYSLKWAFNAYRDRMPESLFPIGGDLGGGVICIGISGDHLGKVFYWDQSNEVDSDDFEEGSDIEKMMFQNVHIAANNFREFIFSLEESPHT